MKKISVLLIALMTLLVSVASASAVAIPGQSTDPDESLPYYLNDTVSGGVTPSDTVVIAVGDSDNVLSIAHSVGIKRNAPVLITDSDKLDKHVVETLQQMIEYGNISKAVVVGTSDNTTNIAQVVTDIRGGESTITIDNIIQEPSIGPLSNTAALYEYETTASVVVADGHIHTDMAKALLIASQEGIPIIYEQAGTTTINDTLDILNASTVYVTPAVDPSTIDDLEVDYTVNDSWMNFDMTTDLEELVNDSMTTDHNTTFVVVKESDNTPYTQLFHATSPVHKLSSAFVVADNSSALGANQSTWLSATSPNMTVLVGDSSVASDELATEIASVTGNPPWRLVYDDHVDENIELSLASNDYLYPVVVADYTKSGNQFDYTFKNLGYSDVVKMGDYSLRVVFNKTAGEFTDSNPDPVNQTSSQVIYHFTETIQPSSSASLQFNVSDGGNFTTYPATMSYNSLTVAGTVVTHQSFFDDLMNFVKSTVSWLQDTFNTILGTFVELIPAPAYWAMALAWIIVIALVWIMIGTIVYVGKTITGGKPRANWAYGPIAMGYETYRRS